MHQPTLKQLKYLCAVAEHKHFGNAAKACFISQSTLSAGLIELEEILGLNLIERNNKRVLVTNIGQEVIARSQQILTAVADVMELARAAQPSFSTALHLGIIPTIAPFVLPQILRDIREQYPEFKLFVKEDLTEHLLRELHEGKLDMLMLALPYPAEGVISKHLFFDDFVLAFDKKNDIAKLKKLQISDLQGKDMLLLEDGHCLRDHALDSCKLKTEQINIPYQATSLHTIVQMVANDIGMTILPEMAIAAKILQGTNVKTRKFDESNVHRSIGLMWRKESARQAEFHELGQLICKTLLH